MNKNNSGHNYNNEEFSKEKNYNNYYSERSTNISKNIIYKNNRIFDGQINNFVPDSKKIMFQNYSKNLKHNGNSYNINSDEYNERGSEFQNNHIKIHKYNSFNEPHNSKINYVRINKSYNN